MSEFRTLESLLTTFLLLLTGCVGAFVRELDFDAATVSELRSEVSTTTQNQLAGLDFESLGQITATSCFNNFVTDQMASVDHAMDQLRYKAANLGANSILNPVCQKEGTSLVKNCWSSVTCTASAIRIGRSDLEASRPVRTGSGSCFVISPDGKLLTNAHVVDGAKRLLVSLPDSRTFDARVLSISRSTDLALLQIAAANLSYLSLAPASAASVGSDVFTVGFPAHDILGTEPKFTDGAVSAQSGFGGESTLLQITVPVQPGNSGGPLVRDDGSVVGVITSTAAVETFYKETGNLPQNISWAVKADYALPLFEAPPEQPPARDRQEAVRMALAALCRIEFRM